MKCPICEKEMKKFDFSITKMPDELLFQCRSCMYTYHLLGQELNISIKNYNYKFKFNLNYKEKERRTKKEIINRINAYRFYICKEKIKDYNLLGGKISVL
jgi:hypothetical protein